MRRNNLKTAIETLRFNIFIESIKTLNTLGATMQTTKNLLKSFKNPILNYQKKERKGIKC